MQIKDAVVLVTGANRGLGKSLVQAFLAAGARKVYAGSRKLVESSDPRLQPIKLDITNAHDIAAAAETCQDINILINNAGIATFTTFLTAPSLDEARNTMETNYIGTLAMIRAFAPILKKNGGGVLVNMLSVLSWFASPRLGSYSASKAAALALTETIRIELRSQGTLVMGVHAGFMDTDMADQAIGPKVSTGVVAASIIEGISSDREEVLADQPSQNVKAMLASNRQAFYKQIQADWDGAQQAAV